MTHDTQLRERLSAAVDGTTVPPGLSAAALSGGRARRRRRTATGVALSALVMAAGGALLLPDGARTASDGTVADGPTASAPSTAGLKWARSLPQGRAPSLPFFGAGGALWDNGASYDVPAEVNRAYPPRTVATGWLVMTGDDEGLALAVVNPAGIVTTVPVPRTSAGEFMPSDVAVSPDGTQVAYGRWLVDLTTTSVTDLPHQPEADVQDRYSVMVRVNGFTDDGLVYQGSPFDRGFGTTYLLRPDGSTVEVEPPGNSSIGQDDPADLALEFDYKDGDTDTCTHSYVLRDEQWQPDGTGCMGKYLGEALEVSPDGEWLLTDDLPKVWNLRDSSWHDVDVPGDLVASWGEEWLGQAAWEDADSFLLPIADRWPGYTSPKPSFDQEVQVVRCTMSTGECERAGYEQAVRVTSTMWGSTEVRFAG